LNASAGPDLILRGGLIHDGSGDPAVRADVAIAGDRIITVGDLAGLAAPAAAVLDVAGLHVAPGFIDMHSHSDTELIAEPLNVAKTRQGITFDLIGQDGLGVAPFDPDRDAGWRRSLLPLTGNANLPWTWRSFGDHLAAIDAAGPATNVGALITYGAVRNAVIGLDARAPTTAEFARIEGLIADAMEAGAFGMSVGLVYPPAVFAATDELVRAFAVVGRRDGLMVIHLRSQGDAWLDAIDEAILIARSADVHLHVSHLCALGSRNWPLVPRALERLAAARAAGLPVTFDQHPYTAASTTLSQVLPPWATEGGPGPMSERLADLHVRARIRAEIGGRGRLGWENYAGLAGWDAVQIGGATLAENRPLVGRTVGVVAAERGIDPFDLTADLLISEAGAVPMVLLGMYDDASVLSIMTAPGGSIGTDGVIAPHPHPRLYGSSARVLGYYARDLGGFSLEHGVRRLGSDGAAILGLTDRGRVTAGAFADLVIFDPGAIEDRATYAAPRQHPAGIPHVIVNGRFVVRDGRETGERPGRVIRRRAS
jgi:N-acyl-D-amino-acid deacylase